MHHAGRQNLFIGIANYQCLYSRMRTHLCRENAVYTAMRAIAEHSDKTYTLLYTKYTALKIGMFALERMVQVMEMTQAGMVYADHYQQIDGVQKQLRSLITNPVACVTTSISARFYCSMPTHSRKL